MNDPAKLASTKQDEHKIFYRIQFYRNHRPSSSHVLSFEMAIDWLDEEDEENVGFDYSIHLMHVDGRTQMDELIYDLVVL